MMVLLLGIAGMMVIGLVWWLLRHSPATHPVASTSSTRRSAAPLPDRLPRTTPAPAAKAVAPALPTRLVPPALASLHWIREAELDSERRLALTSAIRDIPRPPRSLQQLLSPEFLARASSSELGELVMGEPLIAAKVLAAVNSPLYGLHQPVSGMGQAITFLGMNTVRNICLQYLLAEAFQSNRPGSRRAFEHIGRASALASELSLRLGKALHLPDQGVLATQVVLGFVGQLAAASLLPVDTLDRWLRMDGVQRTRHEQDHLGLSAGELGGLLLRLWELPASLVDDVCDASRVLVTPSTAIDDERVPRLALCYLCAHLGERLSLGQLPSLRGHDVQQDSGVDSFHLAGYLDHPTLARLPAALQSTEVQTGVQNLLPGSRQHA